MKNLQCYPSNRPKVSVVTATYNRENLLNICIESVLGQTYKDLEHIIVDDGSQDNTLELVRNYQRKDPRIRYASHSNRRQSLSLNVGIMMAAGDYLCFLDSDDYYLSNHIDSRLAYLEEHSELDFLYGGLKVIGDEYVADANDPSRKIHVDECSGTCSFFAKTNVFRAVGGFRDIVLGNDGDILSRIQEKQFRTKRLKEAQYRTVVYVRTENSITKEWEKAHR